MEKEDYIILMEILYMKVIGLMIYLKEEENIFIETINII